MLHTEHPSASHLLTDSTSATTLSGTDSTNGLGLHCARLVKDSGSCAGRQLREGGEPANVVAENVVRISPAHVLQQCVRGAYDLCVHSSGGMEQREKVGLAQKEGHGPRLLGNDEEEEIAGLHLHSRVGFAHAHRPQCSRDRPALRDLGKGCQPFQGLEHARLDIFV